MTALERDVPSVPLSMGERHAFDRLTRTMRAEYAALARPPRVTRYDTRPSARLRALAGRVARSPFADDLARAWRAAFWPAVACSGLVVGLALVYLTRDIYVTWAGVQDLTPGSAK